MNWLRPLFAVISVFVAAGDAWAQLHNGEARRLSGVVETRDGKRLPHIAIRITNFGSTTTTDSGEFTFTLDPKILPGQRIEFSVPGDWVISWPYEGQEFVPQPGNTIHIRVTHKGDPRLLDDPDFVEKIVAGVTSRLEPSLAKGGITVAPPESYLEAKAKETGLTVEQIKSAIDVWISEAQAPYQKGLAALYEKRFTDASQLLNQSVATSEADLFPKYLALADAELPQGHYTDAEKAIRKALAIKGDYGAALDLLGWALVAQDRFSEAESAIKRAVDVDKRTFGEQALAPDLLALGTLYGVSGRFSEAEVELKSALAIADKAGNRDDLGVLPYLVNYAEVLRNLGKHPQANELAGRAASIARQRTGKDSLEMVGPIVTLALIGEDYGLYNTTWLLLQNAEGIEERKLGPSNPDVARDLTNLAGIALRAAEAGVILDSSDEAARAEGALHLHDNAEALANRALSITREGGRGDSLAAAGPLFDLGAVYQGQGKYPEARESLERVLAIAQGKLGPSDYRVAVVLRELAMVSSDEKKFDEAERFLKNALAIDEKSFGPDHLQTADDHFSFGVLYYSQGRYAEARSEYLLAYDTQLKILGPSPAVRATACRIATTLRQEGKEGEALRYDRLAAPVSADGCRDPLKDNSHK